MIDISFDFQSALLKPIPNQTQSLLDKIDHIINIRNEISHAGHIEINISDSVVEQYITDFTEAADRIYHYLGDYYNI